MTLWLAITFSPWNVTACPLATCPLPYLSSGTTVTVAFLFINFSGNCPSTVAGTFPPTVSRGFGVTEKLSAESLPNLEHDVIKTNEHADKVRMRFLRIRVN